MSSIASRVKHAEKGFQLSQLAFAALILLLGCSTMSSTTQAATPGRAECRSVPSKILGRACALLRHSSPRL